MERKIITTTIFSKNDYKKPVTFGEIPVQLQPDDVILQHFEEPFFSENESWEGHFHLEVHRDRPETDEELEKRTKEYNEFKEELRIKRYKAYLELKKEFEGHVDQTMH